jgi:hypothetical protein
MHRWDWSQTRAPRRCRSSSQDDAPQPRGARRGGRACVCPLRRLVLAVSASVSCAREAIVGGRPGRAVLLCRVRDRTSACGRSSSCRGIITVTEMGSLVVSEVSQGGDVGGCAGWRKRKPSSRTKSRAKLAPSRFSVPAAFSLPAKRLHYADSKHFLRLS